MYIKHDHFSGYNRSGEQIATRGLFLILLQEKNKPLNRDNMRAIVRKVALCQFGHFMMGYARIANKSIVVSGSYGSDGLPLDVDSKIYNMGYPVPPELYDLWANGGGWNSSGNESQSFRQWAIDNLDKLYNVK